jgi:hypothetical protein
VPACGGDGADRGCDRRLPQDVEHRLADGGRIDDLEALARRLLQNVCRGDPDGVEYSASGGLLALRDGQQVPLCFVAEEMSG